MYWLYCDDLALLGKFYFCLCFIYKMDWLCSGYWIQIDSLDVFVVQNEHVLCKVFQKEGFGPIKFGYPFKEKDLDDDNYDVSSSTSVVSFEDENDVVCDLLCPYYCVLDLVAMGFVSMKYLLMSIVHYELAQIYGHRYVSLFGSYVKYLWFSIITKNH